MTDTPTTDEQYLDDWDDREAARKIPGIFANRVFVQPLGDGMVRVNFGQVFDEEPTYHTAVVMTARDAVAFSELIYRFGAALLPPQAPVVRVKAPTPSGEEDAAQ